MVTSFKFLSGNPGFAFGDARVVLCSCDVDVARDWAWEFEQGALQYNHRHQRIPLTTKTVIYVGSHYKALYRLY